MNPGVELILTFVTETQNRGVITALGSVLSSPLAVLVVLHAIIAVTFGLATAYPFNPAIPALLAMLLGILMPWFVWFMFLRLVYQVTWIGGSKRPVADIAGKLRSAATDHHWQISSVCQFLLISFFVASTGYLKELITVLHPFAWDVNFAEFDRWMHFGRDPWQWLLPLTGSDIVTAALNVAYHGWFFALYFAVFVACFVKAKGHASSAFLIAMVLSFTIGGNFLATIFSSAGPVYYERLGYGADFAPLMKHLETINQSIRLPALDVQDGLWSAYSVDGGRAAISAMPSMHVATSVLLALYGFRHSRWLGWFMTGFALTIMVGSVQLGWHYAIDGYAGALLAWACWRIGLSLAKWQHSTTP